LCCLAVKTGFMFGVNSSTYTPCHYQETMTDHEIAFVDNPYMKYDHQQHVNAVKSLRPKYATVLDVMSNDQLPQILDQAAEIAKYAENVIVIPKCDCVDSIPEQYMLGYAVPTSYGGTDLPYSAFNDRRVHLLGGAWGQQRHLIIESGMNIVSLDFNHCHKIAKEAGHYTDEFGRQYALRDTLPTFNRSPLYTCMALSFAGIRAGVDHAQQIMAVRQTSEN
jgi:hypothetical protein